MTYYDRLGVAPDASTDTIKRAYRTLARRFHPDVDASPTAAIHFKAISEAYATLSDPRKRLGYNQSVLAASNSTPSRTVGLSRRELGAAWQRVIAYLLTGGGIALLLLASARWLNGSLVVWTLTDLWPVVATGSALGLLWGIDANFVVADFVARRTLWMVRVIRFAAWPVGLGFIGGSAVRTALTAHSELLSATDQIGFGLTGVGLIIALIATVRDH